MKLSNALSISQPVRLGDHLTTLTDYHANGSYEILKKHVTLFDDDNFAAMIRTTNFEKEEFTTDLKWITEEAYHFLKKSRVQSGDIIMNKIANAGSVYRMPDMAVPVSLAMNLFLLRTDGVSLDQTYTYYYLKFHESYVKTFANGTATKTITKDAVRNLVIQTPDINSQKDIAKVLSAFDDLIRVNKLLIVEYERVLSLIFSDWLQQSPLRDNSKVREPLTKYIDFIRGIEPGSRNYLSEAGEDRVAFLRVGDLNKQSSEIYISTDIRGIKTLENYDIAMTFDGSVGVVKTGLSGAYSTGIRKIVSKDGSLPSSYVYALLKSRDIQQQVMSYARGTTIKHASAAIPHLKFSLPAPSYIERFNELAEPILEQIRILSESNRSVAKTKSTVARAIFEETRP